MSGALEARVRESLDRSVVAFNHGRAEFFEEFAADAVIFTADSKEPIRGREAYRQSYEAALAAQNCEKTVLDRSVQIVGDKAVVTQKAEISQANNTANVLQTLVYGDTSEGLKVLHSQTALLTPNQHARAFGEPVQVVNERIATVAAIVGVAQ